MQGEDGYMLANSEPRGALHEHPAMQPAEDMLHEYEAEEQNDEAERQHAAVQIQKAWRKRMRRKYLDPELLWTDLATEARMQVGHLLGDCQGVPVGKPERRWTGTQLPRARTRRAIAG